MKAKREFYMHGNDRKFADEHLISTMTGEPMPKKWQRFMELTPEEKARWDASLRLDAEYRVAEAQSFPNGIPGGRTRGSGLYTIRQMEEEHERELQKKQMEEAREQYEQSFIPYKTEIRNNTNTVYGNINPVDQLWQNPYNTQTNDLTTGISAFSGLQTEKESAFDVNQAVQKLADRVRSMWESREEQSGMSIPTKLELYEVLSPYGMTYKEIKDLYPQNAQNQEQIDISGMTYEDMQNIGKQIEAELNQIIENKPAGQYITDYEMYEVLSKYGVKYKDWRKIRLALEEKLKSLPIPRRYWRPNETYESIRDDSFDLSGVHGEGIFSYRSINADTTVTEHIWKEIREKLELDEAKICSQLWGFLDEWGKKVLEIALYRIPMPLHIKGALGVILITFAVVEAAKNIKEKRKKAIDDFMAKTKCSEDVARLEVDKKVNGWVAEEVGKGIIGAALEHFLKEKGLSELTRNFITSAWSSFISSAEFSAWQNQMQEAPQ